MTMAEPDGARSVLFALLVLALLSSAVDAVCYLGLGRSQQADPRLPQ